MNVGTKIMMGITIATLGGLMAGSGFINAGQKQERTLLRVGVYDSRAIAIAYGNSTHMGKIIAQKQAELEQAKKDNDVEKVKALEAWGPKMQEKAHLQGFGTAPVHNCLEPVKDKLADVAASCQVDVIVSKWELNYLSPDAAVKDVTDELVALYEPNERVLKSIRAIKDIEPLSEDLISDHKH